MFMKEYYSKIKTKVHRKFEAFCENKLNNKCNMYHVINKNVKHEILLSQCYEWLSNKYSKVISDGVCINEKPKKSNYIWINWFQGEENAPDLVKACIKSIRKYFPDREIIVLSDDNISKYVEFPDFIYEKRKRNIIGSAHYSDLLRLELLCKYGGLWVDATVLCTSPDLLNSIENNRLFVFKQMDLTRKDIQSVVASNWCIYAWTNQRILLLTRELLYQYWSEFDYTANYFIFHLFFSMSTKRYNDDWERVPFYNNHSPHILQFELGKPFSEFRWKEIIKMSDFHKLNHHNDYSKCNGSFYKKIIDEYIQNSR